MVKRNVWFQSQLKEGPAGAVSFALC